MNNSIDNITVKRYNAFKVKKMLKDLLLKKDLSVYTCSKLINIPYTTLLEVISGKTSLLKCSTEIVYKLSKVLNISMEDLIKQSEMERLDYEIYKSNVCHNLKESGDLDFIINTLKSDSISYYWNKKWYFECFYLLAMVDYISKINDLPLCNKYDKIRQKRLPEILYPKDIILVDKLDSNLRAKEEILKKAIPEFLHFNIVESEVRNAI